MLLQCSSIPIPVQVCTFINRLSTVQFLIFEIHLKHQRRIAQCLPHQLCGLASHLSWLAMNKAQHTFWTPTNDDAFPMTPLLFDHAWKWLIDECTCVASSHSQLCNPISIVIPCFWCSALGLKAPKLGLKRPGLKWSPACKVCCFLPHPLPKNVKICYTLGSVHIELLTEQLSEKTTYSKHLLQPRSMHEEYERRFDCWVKKSV